MRRTTVHVCALLALAATAAGCGAEADPVEASTDTSTSASDSATESPSASPSPSVSSLPAGCEPSAKDVEYTSGTATFEVTAGPDQGSYELDLDPSGTNLYAGSDDKEITGHWLSEDQQAVLFIDISGVDPCKPDAFTSIGTQGPAGPLFVDSAHTACEMEVTSLGAEGIQGSFTCSGLTGGGEGLERDAQGTFTMTP